MRGFLIKNGDLSLNLSGYFDTVSSGDKIKRDLYKRLMTDKYWGSNDTSYYRYNPGYGITLNNSALFIGVPLNTVLTIINNAVGSALNDLIASQKQDTQLPMDEVIDTVDYYSYFDQSNPGSVKCKITVTLLNGTTLDLGTFTQSITSSSTYKLPGVSFQDIT